jgi:hypothetical protein
MDERQEVSGSEQAPGERHPESNHASQPAENSASAAIADSPWFWLLIFSAFAVLALLAVNRKYSLRQGGIETKFQNRETALAWEGQSIDSPEAIQRTRLPRSAGDRQLAIPLKPLFIVVGTLAALGLIALCLFQLRPSKRNRSESG